MAITFSLLLCIGHFHSSHVIDLFNAAQLLFLANLLVFIGGGRVGPGRAMPDQEYGPEIINDVILSLILITIN